MGISATDQRGFAPGPRVRPRPPQRPTNRPLIAWRPPPGWPLLVAFLGYPVWWLLGLGSLIFFVMAVPMAMHLWRHRATLVAPGGFGLWLLFLGWVLFGVGVLLADAPGAVPGGGFGRFMVFGWRFAWYLTFTIVLLYVCNLRERELPSDRIARLLGYMFAVTAIGGLVGCLMPALQITSVMEMVLPGSLAQNPFLRDAIHPRVAEISTILGYEQSRPMAPFAYSNTWGAAYAFFLPFFVLTWIIRGRGGRRVAGVLILIASLWPAVYSLNRMLWAALLLMAIFAIIKLVVLAGSKAIGWTIVALLVGAMVVALSPLPALVQGRIDNPHSNNRRTLLAEQTVRSAVVGSPLVGFGSTRDVQGDLNTLAGGERPDCKACGPPPLGTQGHLWLLIFGHGLVGTAAFLAFFILRFARHWHELSPYSLIGCSVLLAFGLFLFTYDMVEVPLYTVMIAVALMWRTQPASGAALGGRTEQP